MNVYAFDVDETLEISGGPVKLQSLVDLVRAGHIVGICGNWGLMTRAVSGWNNVCSFIGPIGIQKDLYLTQLKTYIPADRYILVGNDHKRGQYRSPDDSEFARLSGWEFVSELYYNDQVFSAALVEI